MIGISSYAFHDLPLSRALEKIEGMSECAEIYSEGLHDLFRDAQTPLSYNLKYCVHAPNTDLNIASLREMLKKSSGIKVLEHRNAEYIKKSMAALGKMGIK